MSTLARQLRDVRCRRSSGSGPRWFSGSADAIFQSLNLIYDEDPDYVVVFGADHVYRMDPAADGRAAHRQRRRGHRRRHPHPAVARRAQFGVISTAADGRTIEEFLEKPTDPPGLPDAPDQVFASMGNYVFTTDVLLEALRKRFRRRGLPPRHGRRHRPDAHGPGAGRGLRLPRQRRARGRPSASGATGATSGRSTPTTTRTRI